VSPRRLDTERLRERLIADGVDLRRSAAAHA
jgi:hypothetical protein